MFDNIIISIIDHPNKERFIITERNGSYNLIFLEWNFSASDPASYADPILTDSSFNECMERLVEILKKGGVKCLIQNRKCQIWNYAKIKRIGLSTGWRWMVLDSLCG